MANHVEYHKFFLRSDAKLAKKNLFTLYKKMSQLCVAENPIIL